MIIYYVFHPYVLFNTFLTMCLSKIAQSMGVEDYPIRKGYENVLTLLIVRYLLKVFVIISSEYCMEVFHLYFVCGDKYADLENHA